MFIKNTYSQIEFIKPLINYKLEIAYQNYIFTQKPNYYVRDAQVKVMATYKNDFTPAGTLPATTKLTVNDFHIYGSSRLGKKGVDEILYSVNIPTSPTIIDRSARFLGTKRYELSNHLGNVLEVISDRKLCVDDGGGNVDYYTADVVSYSDYYPFGMLMPNRYTGNSKYRYGYQGSEKDKEVHGESYTTHFRQLDTRIGRWLSYDPKAAKSPWHTPFHSMGNNPINKVDPMGDLEWEPNIDGSYTAEAGDGSWNLWSDHLKGKGYSLEAVESLLADQGYEKYCRDGSSRLAIDPGQIVSMDKRLTTGMVNVSAGQGDNGEKRNQSSENKQQVSSGKLDLNNTGVGEISSDGLSFTFAALYGVNIEFGIMKNNRTNETAPFFNIDFLVGGDASAGYMHRDYTSTINRPLTFKDIEGRGHSRDGGYLIFDYSKGEDASSDEKYKMEGTGISIGSPYGGTMGTGKTIIFD